MALFREILTKIIVSENKDARADYDDHIESAAVVFNNSIMYPEYNSLTRYALFHNNHKHQPSHLLSALPDRSPSDLGRLQKQSLRRINDTRKKIRSRYQNIGNIYSKGQVIMHVLRKEDIQPLKGGNAFRESSSNFYVVTGNDQETSCRVKHLATGTERTLGVNEMKPVEASDIYGNLKHLPQNPHPFLRNIYVKHNKSLVEEIVNRSMNGELFKDDDEDVDENIDTNPESGIATADTIPENEDNTETNEDNETGAEASVQFSNAKVKREDTSPRKRNKK